MTTGNFPSSQFKRLSWIQYFARLLLKLLLFLNISRQTSCKFSEYRIYKDAPFFIKIVNATSNDNTRISECQNVSMLGLREVISEHFSIMEF
jgi:hypothetical protein